MGALMARASVLVHHVPLRPGGPEAIACLENPNGRGFSLEVRAAANGHEARREWRDRGVPVEPGKAAALGVAS